MSASAQIQQAWVARYNNGITNGTNQAVKMTLDSAGNIYVAGFSQNTNGNFGYVTIKYAPNGNQLWATRLDSTNYPAASPAALALDNSNNVTVTGNPLTVKYDANGTQLWTAPYAGTALAIDSTGNLIVTGFGTSFNTVKLSPQGGFIWQTTYPTHPPSEPGPNMPQSVLVDSTNNVYVSGFITRLYNPANPGQGTVGILFTEKYDSNGNQVWIANSGYLSTYYGVGATPVKVAGAALDPLGNIDLLISYLPFSGINKFIFSSFSPSGNLNWLAFPMAEVSDNLARGLGIGRDGSVFVTGEVPINGGVAYGTAKVSSNNPYGEIWAQYYQTVAGAGGSSIATSITVDSADNVYVTGYSPGTNSGNDIVTIKYDNNGKQIWVERHNGPGNGDDEGNAIAVDASGNVYVTGYETTAAGGTEMVTIKYAPGPFLRKEANGKFLLQAEGSPNQNFDFQASTNLQTWQDLGTNAADSNGMVQFLDTNAPLFPYRFYITNPR
jgi:hypothetical protein